MKFRKAIQNLFDNFTSENDRWEWASALAYDIDLNWESVAEEINVCPEDEEIGEFKKDCIEIAKKYC